MRTTPDECRELGRQIGRKLSAATGPVALYVPLRGISMIAVEGQVFHDPDADAALLDGLRETLGPNVEVHEEDADVNDPAFADGDGRPAPRADPGGAMTRERGAGAAARAGRGGRPVIGAGAGTGLSAKCAEAGGADLIIIYNSGRYRMAGRGSLVGSAARTATRTRSSSTCRARCSRS